MDEPEPLSPSELDRALPCLLADPGTRALAGPEQIAGFHDYLGDGSLSWRGWRCGPPGRPAGLCVAILLPGRTAMVMLPEPGVGGITHSGLVCAAQAGLQALAREHLHYAQALLEGAAVGQRAALEAVGFRPLAPLVYLERNAKYPWVDPPAEEDGDWIAYADPVRADFAGVILETYEGSRDCPELSGLRPIEDVLAAHRAAGPFEPHLWELVRIGGQLAGCILLARLARGALLEVVYVGVVPAWRGRGVGSLLLRRALAQCRGQDVPRLTAVVDDRNGPAKRMYDRLAFRVSTRRDALLYRWPS